MFRLVLGVAAVVGTAAVIAVMADSPSSAESRLFSVRTDQPGVSITDAVQNGKDLPVAGENGGQTFFRIDNPNGAVPCANSILFTASNGQKITEAVDFCANDWSLTVALGGGAAPIPTPAPSTSTTIRNATKSTPTTSNASPPAVAVAPPAATAGSATAMRWSFETTPSQATVAYAMPGTPDAGEFAAACQPGSGRATIVLTRTADELGPGGKVWVTFTSGSYSHAFSATGGPVGADNLSHPVLTLLSGDPLWAVLITNRTVSVSIGTTPAYILSLAGSSAPVKQFLAACTPAAPKPLAAFPPPPTLTPLPPAGPGPMVPLPPAGPVPVVPGPVLADTSFACNDGSYISAGFGPSSATVYEPGFPPLTLVEVPFNGDGRRFVAGSAQLIGQGEDVYWSRYGGQAVACSRAAG